jgi:chromosome segregation ATPase
MRRVRPDLVPKAVRRIATEQKELVERSHAMAGELRDPHGRARALAEANELALELAQAFARLGSSDEIASEVLDDAVNKLQLLDTRVTLLYEKLRVATERTTAVLVE